jgi:antagonist of KipI
MPVLVLSAGFQTTVQDCGRFGFRKYGVATAGALDSAGLRVLNLLVGNRECAAGLEIVNGRVRLQFTDDRLLAWSGGHFEVRIGTLVVPQLQGACISSGQVCEVLPKRARAWLAISGGIDVSEILGSRSTDLRARFGGFEGRVLRDSDDLSLGPNSATAIQIRKEMVGHIAQWSGPQLLFQQKPKPVGEAGSFPYKNAPTSSTLRIIRGKNWSEEIETKFLTTGFQVTVNSDRMGLRLESSPIKSGENVELVSEAVAPGTIQLPPAGLPIVLLADCQTIGGYPKIAHVITVDLALAAQLQPMDEVRFELTSLDEAQELLRNREHDIALFRAGVRARFG